MSRLILTFLIISGLICLIILVSCSSHPKTENQLALDTVEDTLSNDVVKEIYEEYVIAAKEIGLPTELKITDSVKYFPIHHINKEINLYKPTIGKDSNFHSTNSQPTAVKIRLAEIRLFGDESRIILSVSWGIRAGYVVERRRNSNGVIRTIKGRV